jgi:TolB-like protein
VDVMNGWQLWGEQYQTPISDVLIVQQEITAAISERLRIRLSLDEDSSRIFSQLDLESPVS